MREGASLEGAGNLRLRTGHDGLGEGEGRGREQFYS